MPDTSFSNTLPRPERDIQGGHVTHEYLPGQQMQAFFDQLTPYITKAIIEQATLATSGIEATRNSWKATLESSSALYPAAKPFVPFVQYLVDLNFDNVKHFTDLSYNTTQKLLDIYNALGDEARDEANRLVLAGLYAGGEIKKVMGHYSKSLGLKNKLINQNGKFFSFADPQHGSEMRELDASEGSEDINPREWFKAGQEGDWPILTLMSNTSAARDLDDIAVVAHGIENLYYAANDDAPKRPIKVVSTLFTRKNSLANGEVIAQRIENIQKDHQSTNEEKDYHMHRRNLEGITPDVVRLGNLFLSCLLENPSDIDITRAPEEPLEHGGELPAIHRNGERNAPLQLREDYLEVAKHIRFAGYSRGGNIATDAWRYAARQLVGNGREDGLQPSRFLHADGTPLDNAGAKEILAATGVLSVGAWETPASDIERELGLHRVSLVNQNDHLIHEWVRTNGDYPAYRDNDELFVVEGVKGNIAHAPREAMIGNGKEVGYFTDPNNKILNPCNKTKGACALSIPEALKDFFSINARAHSRAEAKEPETADSVIIANSVDLAPERAAQAFAIAL